MVGPWWRECASRFASRGCRRGAGAAVSYACHAAVRPGAAAFAHLVPSGSSPQAMEHPTSPIAAWWVGKGVV
eukprot:3353078-Prymnesium_polylepis.1